MKTPEVISIFITEFMMKKLHVRMMFEREEKISMAEMKKSRMRRTFRLSQIDR